MGLTQTDVTVNEKRIVGITRRLTYCYTACMSEPVARPYYEIIKRIIRMNLKPSFTPLRNFGKLLAGGNAEIYADKVAGYLLGGTSETGFAVVSQKLNPRFIRTANPERTSTQM
jgi:hypothetical protein